MFAPPMILTEKCPDAYHSREYSQWLSAREGGGKYKWYFGEGEHPEGLKLDPLSGELSGVIRVDSSGNSKRFEFEAICETLADETSKLDKRNLN